MRTGPRTRAREAGIALLYTSLVLVLFMLITGLAIDLGRGYVIRLALAKAVDAAALAAARVIPQGEDEARTAAENIFNANFPDGFLGVTSVDNPPEIDFAINEVDSSDVITVTSHATIANTFMRVAGFDELTVGNSGVATRRLIDLSFVLDRSGSLSSVWPQVKAASKTFVNYFDTVNDRLALTVFSTNTVVLEPMATGRGFDLTSLNTWLGNGRGSITANGSTSTAEGLYQGWDQLRSVPVNNQSSLRVIVLFTDGSPNTFGAAFDRVSTKCPGNTPPSPFVAYNPPPADAVLTTNDFSVGDNGSDQGLFKQYGTIPSDTGVRVPETPSGGWAVTNVSLQTVNPCIPNLPANTMSHHGQQVSSGIPLGFTLDSSRRPLIGDPVPNGYPNHPHNANNAARNLLETIAAAARQDGSGRSPIHILTLGLGAQLEEDEGTADEKGSEILSRVANDPSDPDYDPDEPEGRYFFANNISQLEAAFESVRDLIVRLSQ